MEFDIKQIPTNELLDDKAASLSDIAVCNFALLQGITEYSGGSVQKRLETNQRIVEVIDLELSRREAELHIPKK